jgi:homoserine dehydrogenase
LREGLVGNRVENFSGILNGTCNYILTRMGEDRVDFATALRQAQENGFAEADPALDVDGFDAAQKLKILAELAFNVRIKPDSIRVQGIRDITHDDLEHASHLGFVIKHVASAITKGGGVALSAEPMLLPRSHLLAAVHNENNAVVVRGDAVGEVLFSGKGAGSLPSASAVLSDLVDIACHQGGFTASPGAKVALTHVVENASYYLRFPVRETSAIGSISEILERNGIRVSRAAATWSRNGDGQHQVRLLTEACARKRLDVARADISRLALVEGTSLALRIAD